MPLTLSTLDLRHAWEHRAKDVYVFLKLDRARIGTAFNTLWLVWSAEDADYPNPVACQLTFDTTGFTIGHSAPFKPDSFLARALGGLRPITDQALYSLIAPLVATR